MGVLELENKQNADVLILAGDICVASQMLPKHEWFFENCANEFKDVIYIMGNHEHYNGDFQYTLNTLRNTLKPFSNIHILDKETVKIDNVNFYGATFWTNMNERDPHVMEYVNRNMNDFRIVANGYGKVFNTLDAAREHDAALAALEFELAVNEGKFVVVTHHSPSANSIHQRYKLDTEMNYGYHSRLESFIELRPEIELWIHGHVHDGFDYKVGDTRIVCNPRGYIGYEVKAHAFELKYVEV